MTIKITYARVIREKQRWSCWLEISRKDKSWLLPTAAPDSLSNEELQEYFEAQENHLWEVAEQEPYPAFSHAILEEINYLRKEQGDKPINEEEFMTSVRDHHSY